MKNIFFCVYFCLITFFSFSQYKKKSTLKPYKIGVLYNYGTEENFIFNDKDYTYSTNTYKFQALYTLGNWKNFDVELIVQPQIQFLKHQLINEFYVTPNEVNYLEKIAEFTKPKSMNLYGLEFGFSLKKEVSKKIDFVGTLSLGFMNIDKRSERLAKGFTFIENLSFGFSHQTFKNSFIFFGTNFGHVSNLNFQKPNDGYNILGIEIGYSFLIN